ncbi:MAG: hypothetical protein Q9213_005597 [Squamulea squamosa]
MKSTIISAVFGTVLAIQGVSGAVMPVNAVKRDEALTVRSGATEETHSLAVKRAVPAVASSATVLSPIVARDVASVKSDTDPPTQYDSTNEDLSPTFWCELTDEGFLKCDGVQKRDEGAIPSMNNLKKRIPDIGMVMITNTLQLPD